MFYQQRNEFDCLLASLANAVGRDPTTIFPEKFCEDVERLGGTFGSRVATAFEYAGLRPEHDYWVCTTGCTVFPNPRSLLALLRGRRALLQVPSLNNPPPAQHIVYWTGKKLFDPSLKQTYRWLDQLRPETIWIFNETPD